MRAARFMALGAVTLALAGCQEKLSAPGDCPGICPGDQSVVFDTLITPVFGGDSTYGPGNVGGYVSPGEGSSLRVSNGLAGADNFAVVRFVARPDVVTLNGTDYPYTIDSVLVGVTLLRRDPAATGLNLEIYRLSSPATVDSTRTFTQVQSDFAPANLLTVIPIPDTLQSGVLRKVFTGAALGTIAIPAADAGVLALGYRITAPAPTGIRIGSSSAGTAGPTFLTYYTPTTADTALLHQPPLPRIVAYNGFVSSVSAIPDSTTITVGGVPSSRALLRFSIPARIRDSSTIIRATLELTPLAPMTGLPGDTVALDVRSVLADLGAKSPRLSNPATRVLTSLLTLGSTDTVRVDVTTLVDLWQNPSRLPPALFLALQPEGSSFSQAVFGSTRQGVSPRLRLTYVLPFPFETP
ncbi:MAG: hypothetical protein ACM3OH_04585 [Bacillota bacterium]